MKSNEDQYEMHPRDEWEAEKLKVEDSAKCKMQCQIDPEEKVYVAQKRRHNSSGLKFQIQKISLFMCSVLVLQICLQT